MIVDELLLTHQISSKIIDIIDNAEKDVFLISPYIQVWNLLERAFERAKRNNKDIVIVTRENTDCSWLNDKYNIDILYVPNLHTKMYFNEKELLISSMNLYDYSKENNFEIGIIRQLKDNKEYQTVIDKVINEDFYSNEDTWYLEGSRAERKEKEKIENSKKNLSDEIGLCIRCGINIPFNKEKPLCNDCFEIWNYYKNGNYNERFCHKCGKDFGTPSFNCFMSGVPTFDNPLCNNCTDKR